MTVLLSSAGFLLGVALETAFSLSAAYAAFSALAGLAVLIAAFTMKARRVGIVAGLVLLALALGFFRADMEPGVRVAPLEAVLGEEVVLEGVVSDEPDVRDTSVLLTVSVEQVNGSVVDGVVLAVLPAHSESAYGDRVQLQGVLELPEAFETDTGRVFDYPGYLSVRRIGYSLLHPEVTVLGKGEGNKIIAALFSLKQWYLEGMNRALSEPHAALAGGITVGAKRSLGEKLLDDFRTTGIIHIVVLSGYNMTIIAEMLLRVLAFLPLRFGLAAGALSIVLFALMTGAGASIVRASIMAILALIARAVGRNYVITRALMLAVVGMVAWNPAILLHDPGFQLSVLATIGLVYVSPFIERKLLWVPERFGLRTIVGATIGTQLTVMPLLLYQMGTLSLSALPVNLLILPFVPTAMLFSLLAALGGALVPALGMLIGIPAYLVLSYAFIVVDSAASIPFSAVSVPPFPLWLMFTAYGGMFVWLWRIHGRAQD